MAGALTREQERSLWLHQALLAELLTRPTNVLEKVRHNGLDRLRSAHRRDGMTAHYLDAWSGIIESGLDTVIDTLTSRTPAACDLRQNTPFAGVLPDESRRQVLHSFNPHWSSEHEAA